MKKFKFLAVIVMITLVGTTSCKKKNDVSLLGTWTSTGEDAIVIEAGAYSQLAQAALSSVFKMPQTLVFNEDKTGSATMDNDVITNFTYTDALGNIAINFESYEIAGVDIARIPIVFSYSITNNKLSLSSDILEHVKLFFSLSGQAEAQLLINVLTKAEIKGNYTK